MSDQHKPQTETTKVKEPKEPKKPNDDWKKKAEEKKLKKQKDQEMEKNKKQLKQSEAIKLKQTKKQDRKQEKQQEKQQKKQQPKTDTKADKQNELKSTPNVTDTLKLPIQRPTTIQEILPTRKVQLRTKEIDVKNILLSYTPQLINQDDSTLLASTHEIIRDWSDLNIGQVVDIWGIAGKSSRRQNVIKTRFQDVSYFSKTITKVICGASAVFQNGAILSTPGTLFLAVLAYEYNIPFIVLGSSHKYYDISVLQGDYSQYEGQIYDIIPSKYISLMVTEAGPINICSVQTLFKQLHLLK